MNAQDKDMERAYEQAQAQANSIATMVAALEVDYVRLEELKDELASLEFDLQNADTEEEKQDVLKQLTEWRTENAEELAELEEAANGMTDCDEAREAIQNDALDVQVRSAWYNPCASDESDPSEFMILLCTGGPAVRIMGELDDYLQPKRAWLEYQDWFQPWTEAPGIIDRDTLLTYCAQFYFGE
jgi:DNA-binding transcriptional MerR regulator